MEVVATDAARLTAMPVAMNSHRRFPKRSLKWHVADIKNIAGDDQIILSVDKRSATVTQSFEMLEWYFVDVRNIAGDDHVTLTIMKSFEMYVYEIVSFATDAGTARYWCQETLP